MFWFFFKTRPLTVCSISQILLGQKKNNRIFIFIGAVPIKKRYRKQWIFCFTKIVISFCHDYETSTWLKKSYYYCAYFRHFMVLSFRFTKLSFSSSTACFKMMATTFFNLDFFNNPQKKKIKVKLYKSYII